MSEAALTLSPDEQALNRTLSKIDEMGLKDNLIELAQRRSGHRMELCIR